MVYLFTILFGVLAFSGVSETGRSHQAPTRTELRVSIQNNARITAPYYGLSAALTGVGFDQGYGQINTKAFLFHYEKTLDIRFLNNVKHWISYKEDSKFRSIPYTRRNYHEVISNSLRG